MALFGRDVTEEYKNFMKTAERHYQNAEWEDMGRALESAKECCEQDGFPDRLRCKRKVYGQYGALERRYGRYKNAIAILMKSLELEEHDSSETFQELINSADGKVAGILQENDRSGGNIQKANNLERLETLGELGTVYRHIEDLTNAGVAFHLQHSSASRLVWQAEAEVCRAIGNIGMIKYQQAIRMEESSDATVRTVLLNEAISDCQTRVDTAAALRTKLSQIPDDQEAKRLEGKAHSWEAIGVVRLVLCYLAKGEVEMALEKGRLGMAVCETMNDPTSRAHARFYHGLALWRTGSPENRAEAVRLFEFQGHEKRDGCTPAIAFCKEPSEEYRMYLQFLLEECHVRVDHYDEQGYSALDYAVFSDDQESQKIILSGLVDVPTAEGVRRTWEEAMELKDEANLRKHYRIMLQEHFRPMFSEGGRRAIASVKDRYAQLLENNQDMRDALDELKYIKCSVFKRHGRLPRFDDGPDIVEHYQNSGCSKSEDVAVVFMSYRWIGLTSQPPIEGPDDVQNTQYRRMCDAIEKLLEKEDIDEDRLGIWLDVACIDQLDKRRGIAALPLVIAQCNYMISLVDDSGEYYTRGWCCSEVLLMTTLEESYHQHRRFEHMIINLRSSPCTGTLKSPPKLDELVPSQQKLTNGKDRSQIRFLERQSRLLGNR